MSWRPGQHRQSLQLEEPYEDVPAHLQGPILSWVLDGVAESNEMLRAACIYLRLPAPDPMMGPAGRQEALKVFSNAIIADGNLLLNMVEFLLSMTRYHQTKTQLESVLRLGNSAYRVRDDFQGLELRVSPEVKAQVQAVVDAAEDPGVHLRDAWALAYARLPDPVKAYSEAIKAVEAASAPVISPQNQRATLGTLIADINNKPSKWAFALGSPPEDGVTLVRDLMKALWAGQSSRHGGNNSRPETVEEARAAVHLAATLVQFFIGKAFTAVP